MTYQVQPLAIFGIDVVTFGTTSNDLQLADQPLAITSSEELPIGLFGLAPGAVDFGSSAYQSLLNQLKSSGQVESFSYSYTAGSVNSNAPASLILGGYDAARFDAGTTTYHSMPNPINVTLVVQLAYITISTTPPTVWSESEPLSIPIDGSTAQIWLPPSACKHFENAFHLSLDEPTQLYLVNQSLHDQLQRENTRVSFTILDQSHQPATYTLPFSAFDLTATYPLVNTTSYYFPLRRASTPAQSILGRAFLQEMYITVDYDRANFSLAQAYHGGNPRIFAIAAPANSSASPSPTSSSVLPPPLPAPPQCPKQECRRECGRVLE